MEKKRIKAVGLLSGGLDSTIAAKLILEQGIEVYAINFTSPFCTCTPKKAGLRGTRWWEYMGVQGKSRSHLPLKIFLARLLFFRGTK